MVIAIAQSNDGPPRRPHTGINHDRVHSSSREVRVGLRDRDRSVEQVERLDRVRNVDNRRPRHNVENDALYGAHEMIVGPKIGSKSDDRTMRQLGSSLGDRIFPVLAKLIGREVGSQGT